MKSRKDFILGIVTGIVLTFVILFLTSITISIFLSSKTMHFKSYSVNESIVTNNVKISIRFVAIGKITTYILRS